MMLGQYWDCKIQSVHFDILGHELFVREDCCGTVFLVQKVAGIPHVCDLVVIVVVGSSSHCVARTVTSGILLPT